MKNQHVLLVILAIGAFILIINTQPPANPFSTTVPVQEGFVNNGTNSLVGTRCGVDLFPCRTGLRCANGFCISQESTTPIDKYPLPVLPLKN